MCCPKLRRAFSDYELEFLEIEGNLEILFPSVS